METKGVGNRSPSVNALTDTSHSDGDVSAEPFRRYSVDEALTFIGHGAAQRQLLFVLGIGCATFSANIVLMSYLEPNVKCEWRLSTVQQTMLSVAVFLGMAIGSNLWGSIADRYGRRLGVILSLTVEGIASVIASIAPNYAVLMTVRGIVGIGVGGLATCLSTYSEFLPTAFRGYGLCCFQLFWGLGAVSEAALAWLVVPRYGWRVLTFVTAMPSLLLLPFVVVLPESPRYLLVTRQGNRAKDVLERIARVNGTTLPFGSLKNLPEETSDQNVAERVASLFARPFDKITPILWFLSFVLGVGYYATVILTASIRTDGDDDETCDSTKAIMTDVDYASILIDASAELPGALLALLTVENLGRVRSLLLSWCICWCSMLLLLAFPSGQTVFLFGIRLAAQFTDIFLFVLAPELYPSSTRCFAIGTVSAASQVGGMLSPFLARELLDVAGLKTVCALSASLFFAADVASCFLLPFETAGRAMWDEANDSHGDGLYARFIDDSVDGP